MFHNIGRKIKGFAQFLTWTGILFSVLAGLVLLGSTSGLSLLLYTPIGCLLSWLGSMILYGFGELIECTQRIAERLDPPAGEETVHHEGWTCPHCGTKNLLGNAKCTSCGKS